MTIRNIFKYFRIWWIALILAIIIMVYNGIQLSKRSDMIYYLTNIVNNQKNRIITYETNDSIRLIKSCLGLDPNMEMITLSGVKVKLVDVFNTRKLVIRYSKLSCNSCVENEFELLKEFVKKIGANNIVMITDYENTGNLFRFLRINKMEDFDVYLTQDHELQSVLEFHNMPYYFILDSRLILKSIFIPNKEDNEFTKSYFNSITKYFFDVQK